MTAKFVRWTDALFGLTFRPNCWPQRPKSSLQFLCVRDHQKWSTVLMCSRPPNDSFYTARSRSFLKLTPLKNLDKRWIHFETTQYHRSAGSNRTYRPYAQKRSDYKHLLAYRYVFRTALNSIGEISVTYIFLIQYHAWTRTRSSNSSTNRSNPMRSDKSYQLVSTPTFLVR